MATTIFASIQADKSPERWTNETEAAQKRKYLNEKDKVAIQ